MTFRLKRPPQGRRYTVAIAGAAALVVVLAVVAALQASGGLLWADPEATATPTMTPTRTPTLTPTPTQTPPPPAPSGAPVTRVTIPSIGVDASTVVMGVDGNGVMIAPYGPYEVAWYNFSSRPGAGGNIVMAGHVDWITVGAAVFYSLGSLGHGDEVRLTTVDGATHTYRVVSNVSYYVSSVPIGEVVGSTAVESVTMITCGGTFNYSTGEYDQRVVVRAERVS